MRDRAVAGVTGGGPVLLPCRLITLFLERYDVGFRDNVRAVLSQSEFVCIGEVPLPNPSLYGSGVDL